jgi:hypothetical protein
MIALLLAQETWGHSTAARKKNQVGIPPPAASTAPGQTWDWYRPQVIDHASPIVGLFFPSL